MLMTAILALAALAIPVGSWAQETTPLAAYAEAVQFYENGNFAKALTAIDSSIGEEPDNYPAVALRAELEMESGDRKAMRGDAGFILEKLGDSPRTRGNTDVLAAQAIAFSLEGEPGKAAEIFDRILDQPSVSPATLAAAARTYGLLGRSKDALGQASRALAQGAAPLYYRERASAEIESGLYGAAVADLISALRLNSGFPGAYVLLGDALAGSGDAVRGREAYQKALILHPADVAADLGLVRLDMSQGRQDQAQAQLEAALKADPDGYAPRLARAEMLFKERDRKDALQDYQAALGSEDFPAQEAELAAKRLLSLGDYQDALDAYGRALDYFQGSGDEEARVLLGESEAFAGAGNLEKALDAAKKALKIDRRNAQAWLRMGSVEYAMGRPEKALSDMNKAVEMAPSDPQALLRRGELFFRMNDAAKALADFNSAVSLDSRTAQAYNDLGVLESVDFSDYGKAEANLRTALSLDSKNPEFYFNLGLLGTRRNSFGPALDAFNSALSLGGPQDLILKNRAKTYARLGDRTEALADIQTVLSENPKDASAYTALGWIDYRAADYEDAQAAFEQALGIESQNSSALWGLGDVYGAQGSSRRALRNLSDALDADPTSPGIALALCQERRAAGDISSSIRACDSGISHAPNLGALYYQRALDEIINRRPDKALSDIKQAEKYGLRMPEEFLALAVAHAALARYREAHEDYEEAYSLNPDARQISVDLTPPSANPEGFYDSLNSAGLFQNPNVLDPYAFILRGDALSNAGHCDEAIEEFSRAIQIGGNLADAYQGRARCLAAQGQYDNALQDLQTALSSAPADAFLYDEKAKTLVLMGRYPDALQAEIQAVRINDRYAEAYLEAGHIRYFMKKYPKALANYELSVRCDSSNPRNYGGVGLGYFGLGKYPEAIESFSTAIALDPRCADFYKNRGSAYADMGQYQNALADFRTGSVINTDPELVRDYNRLIEEAQARLAQGKP